MKSQRLGMLFITLVVFASAVSCQQMCSWTGRVDPVTSQELLMTCRCEVSRDPVSSPITRIRGLLINEKTHHKNRSFLVSYHGGELRMDKYHQNYYVKRQSFSSSLAILTLAFQAKRSYEFSCTVSGFNDHLITLHRTYYITYHPQDRSSSIPTTLATTTTTTTTIRTTSSFGLGEARRIENNSPTEDALSTPVLTIVIIVSLLIVLIVLVVVIITVTRKRQSPVNVLPPSNADGVPLDVVLHLLQEIRQTHVTGPRHVTPTASNVSLYNETIPSGSYAICDPSSSSSHDVIEPFLRGHDVTTNVLSEESVGRVLSNDATLTVLSDDVTASF